MKTRVEVEEIVTRDRPSNNGANPFWCNGAPLIYRNSEEVFISVRETGPDVPESRVGHCNCRWRLWRRKDQGQWEVVNEDEWFDQREPCPLGGSAKGDLFISSNPVNDRQKQWGACTPEVLRFSQESPERPGEKLKPVWGEGTHFTEHSYRGMGVDGGSGEILLLHIQDVKPGGGYYYPSFRDAEGKWHAREIIRFPVSSCYPQVVVSGRTAHVQAIMDIIETVEEWRALKLEKTQWEWDYTFRRLFYAFTTDVLGKPFSKPLEVDSAESTCGFIGSMDLLPDQQGRVHSLYTKTSHQYDFIRDEFFPGQPITHTLVHAVIENGEVVERRELFGSVDGKGMTPGCARLHLLPDGRVAVIAYASWNDEEGALRDDNFLIEIPSEGEPGPLQPIGLEHPLVTFHSNTPRGGSEPSFTVDIFGVDKEDAQMGTHKDSVIAEDYAIRYARLRLD